MKIIVGSQNPVKQKAVALGFQHFFKGTRFQIEGIAVPSGVTDQPMNDAETLQGARQRALNARKAYPQANFWVGIEGGVQPLEDDLLSFAWIAVLDAQGRWGLARSGSFLLPPAVAALVKQSYELGTADDMVFGLHNSKQQMGAVGLLTANTIDRTALYEHAVILALIPFGEAWQAARL